MKFRNYTPKDKSEVLNLLELNIPKYFAPSELQDFSDYLDNEKEEYFVVTFEGNVVASGGINYFAQENLARISWDVVHPGLQGKGIGSFLVNKRIEKIKENPLIKKIVVRTSQLVFPFYEKLGFNLTRTEKDFWAKDLDLYYMEMNIK